MTYQFLRANIEEFEQGDWIADLWSTQSFGGAGTFILPDGSEWTGTTFSERLEFAIYHTRVVGGKNKIDTLLQDKYYSGNVSLQVAASDICSEAGEAAGTFPPGLFLNTYQRQASTASVALDYLSQAFGMIWWIDRAGLVNISTARPVGPAADGLRVGSDVDSSAILIQPKNVTLGAQYGVQSVNPMTIRHVRWHIDQDKFEAHIYPIPFLFTGTPVPSFYDRPYEAIVESDNGDGTVDVFASRGDGSKFGVQRVRIFGGLPGVKMTMRNGDDVTLGFLGGNPKNPYCVAVAQDQSASKQIARNTDPVKTTIQISDFASIAGLLAPMLIAAPSTGVISPTGVPAVGTQDINGTIQGGSGRASLGD